MATTNKVKGWTGVLMTEDSLAFATPSCTKTRPF